MKAVSLGVYFASAAAVRVEFDRKGKECEDIIRNCGG